MFFACLGSGCATQDQVYSSHGDAQLDYPKNISVNNDDGASSPKSLGKLQTDNPLKKAEKYEYREDVPALRFAWSGAPLKYERPVGNEWVVDDEYAAIEAAVSGHDDVDQSFKDMLQKAIGNEGFPCRYPAIADYFVRRYGLSKAEGNCSETFHVLVSDSSGGNELIELSPARVSEIHILYASEGSAHGSGFGHIGFRLVICKGPESPDLCSQNLLEHLVFSFQANIPGHAIDYFKSIIGGYSSHLYAKRFIDALDEYNSAEFRDLYSVPIRLSVEEKTRLLNALVEAHWRYSGEYKFISDNCSTKAMRLLSSALPEKSIPSAILIYPPNAAFALLLNSSYVAGKLIEDPKEAEEKGFYFPSNESYLNEGLKFIRENNLGVRESDLSEYVDTSPEVRIERIKGRKNRGIISGNSRLRSAYLMLEAFALSQYRRTVMVLGTRQMARQESLDKVRLALKDRHPGLYRVLQACVVGPIVNGYSPAIYPGGIPKANEVDVGYGESCRSRDVTRDILKAMIILESQDPIYWGGMILMQKKIIDTLINISLLSGPLFVGGGR